MVSYFVLGGYMNIGGLIAKLLLVNAANVYGQKKAQEAMPKITEMVEQYYMTFFGEIFLADERNWILENKIRPLVSKMSNEELINVLKTRDKNNKLIKRNKPVEEVLVDEETIKKYHLEYHNEKKKKEFEKEQAYLKANERAQAEKMMKAEKEKMIVREKAEKRKKWAEYVEQFKKYNKAQKKSELEWFKNKLADNFTDSQNEKDLYIHELEMIMLGDEK